MKILIVKPLIVLSIGFFFLIGCGEKAQDAAKKVGEKTQAVTESAKKTAESAAAWTSDKMNAYAGETKKKMGDFNTQLEELSSKAQNLSEDAKVKYKEQLAALAGKREAVAKKMEELQGASGEAWVKVKQELDKLMAEMAQLYENVKKNFTTT
ncbi:MAG: hypothetical protein WCD88_12240 [Desulfobacterales bacterium]